MAGELLDHLQAGARVRLPAADRARKKQPQQLRVMQLRQERLRDAARFLDRIGRGGDGRAEIAGGGERVLAAVAVHARPHG